MRRAAPLMAVLMLFSVTSAQAGWFGTGKPSLPKPVDSPIVRPKVKEDHKAACHVRTLVKKYNSATWGANWGQVFKDRPRPVKPYLR